MNKYIIQKNIQIAIIFCLILIMPIILCGCGKKPEPIQKAIIILPGIMGSNLYDANTNENVWPKIDISANMADPTILLKLKRFLDFDHPQSIYKMIDTLSIDSSGKPAHDCKTIQSEYLQTATYGTNNMYEKLYQYLLKNFGNKYQIKIFEYDWRLNNYQSAIALENFVNQKKYKSIILIGHSMGGIVASNFIAKNDANRKIVEKFIPIATPFFGANKALQVLEDPLQIMDTPQENIAKLKDLINKINGETAFDDLLKKMKDFVCNIPSIYELLPSEKMCDAYKNKNSQLFNHSIFEKNEIKMKNYDEFIQLLKNNPFINNRCVDNMKEWQNLAYIGKAHATNKVECEILAGDNLPTCSEVIYNSNRKMVNTFNSLEGDGTVPLYSATCAINTNDKKITIFKDLSHMELVQNIKCFEKIKDIIDA